MAITVGVYLGKKDRFLRNWYDILPRGQFPLLVKYCIQSYLKGIYFPLNTICDSDSFRERLASMKKLSPTQRNVTFTEEDGPVFKWVEEVDNGYRSEEIKTILKDTIVHTLLEEHERTPLARQRYNHLWKKPESPMYKPATEDMRIHWQGGESLPRRDGNSGQREWMPFRQPDLEKEQGEVVSGFCIVGRMRRRRGLESRRRNLLPGGSVGWFRACRVLL